MRPAASASAICAAAAAGLDGSPSARGKTLAPPPGTKPNGTRPAAPLIASLYVPSPENTTTASASAAASSASACAWPRASVFRVTTSATARSARSTCSSRGGVTFDANGLTMSTTRRLATGGS